MVYINNSMLPRTNKHLSIKERFYIEKDYVLKTQLPILLTLSVVHVQQYIMK